MITYVTTTKVDCSSGQFKSAKLKDKEHTLNAPIFFHNIEKRKRLMHQILTFVGRWSAVYIDRVSYFCNCLKSPILFSCICILNLCHSVTKIYSNVESLLLYFTSLDTKVLLSIFWLKLSQSILKVKF